MIASIRLIFPCPPFFQPLYILLSSGSTKKPGSSIVYSQSIILFSSPYSPIAGFIVDAGEYLPCPALSKNGLSLSLSNWLKSACDIPLVILLIGNDGELTYVTIAPVSISIATTAPLLLSNCSYAVI